MESQLDPHNVFSKYRYFGHLRFDDNSGRVSLDGSDFHSGDGLEVLVGKEWIEGRIEHSTDFYLILCPPGGPMQKVGLDDMLGLIARSNPA